MALFVVFAIFSIFPYMVYPLLVAAWARLSGRPWRQADLEPSVSIIISAHNEEGVITRKLHNSLDLEYPADRLEVLVVSDGSTDRTVPIVRSFRDPRVRLIDLPNRVGKCEGLNRAVPLANGILVVLTDANAMLPKQALGVLTRNFADPEVGLVTGWTRYVRQDWNGEPSSAIHAYTLLERFVKQAESHVGSCVGADGAIFGVRKTLYRPLLPDDLNDLVTGLDVVEQGFRAVLDPDLYCIEPWTGAAEGEFRRQTRIANQLCAAMWRSRRFLAPWRFGAFAACLGSHKLMRLLVPFSLAGSVVSALWLLSTSKGGILLWAPLAWVVGFVILVAFGVVGIITSGGGRVVQLAAHIVGTLTAQTAGWIRWIRGAHDVTWEPERGESRRSRLA